MKVLVRMRRGFDLFMASFSQEMEETREAVSIVRKHVSGEDITEEEGEKLREQVYDILKMTGIGIPFALIPGASVILVVVVKLAKKRDINLLPSAFIRDDETEKDELQERVDSQDGDPVHESVRQDTVQDERREDPEDDVQPNTEGGKQ